MLWNRLELRRVLQVLLPPSAPPSASVGGATSVERGSKARSGETDGRKTSGRLRPPVRVPQSERDGIAVAPIHSCRSVFTLTLALESGWFHGLPLPVLAACTNRDVWNRLSTTRGRPLATRRNERAKEATKNTQEQEKEGMKGEREGRSEAVTQTR